MIISDSAKLLRFFVLKPGYGKPGAPAYFVVHGSIRVLEPPFAHSSLFRNTPKLLECGYEEVADLAAVKDRVQAATQQAINPAWWNSWHRAISRITTDAVQRYV